jgi:expansin (peptidoglycan-binding protein)|tara:strand:- start:1282 stop:1647 length:366 start_codon:yes stop_codon:yes gene_type:complete
MSRRTQEFAITGSTTLEVADAGIQSVEGEAKKTLIRIWISVSAWNGAIVKAYEGQTQKQGAYDTSFRGYAAIASMTNANGELMVGFEVNRELTVGNPYKAAVGAAGTATSIRGAYEYDQDD